MEGSSSNMDSGGRNLYRRCKNIIVSHILLYSMNLNKKPSI
ncbi:hypothetical protein [Clostridium hydrogeniformans]|nr:hypothetical protein [Clostridium hydrogeniformans]